MLTRDETGARILDRGRLGRVLAEEEDRFVSDHPRSRQLYEEARRCLLGGVPMSWMVRWAGRFPVFVQEGSGAHFTDVDGRRYLDLCLGDTGGMSGHTPGPVIRAVTERIRRGVTFMLPTEDAIWVGQELARRFGLPYWQFALTATDANRFALRLARQATGRRYVLVFNWCYHGTEWTKPSSPSAEGGQPPDRETLGRRWTRPPPPG